MNTKSTQDRRVSGQLLQKGISSYNAGDFAAAGNFFRRAIRASSQSGAIEAGHKRSAKIFLYLAHSNHSLGHPAKAIRILTQATRKYPDYFDAFADLGKFLAQQRRFRQAQRAYEKAVQLKPESVEICLNLAQTYKLQGKTSMAEALLRRIVHLHPDCFQAHMNLGEHYRQKKLLNEAGEALCEALRIDPHSIQARVELGKVYGELGEREKAAAILREAFYQRQAIIAKSFIARGELKKAEGIIRRSIQLDPTNDPLDAEKDSRKCRAQDLRAGSSLYLELGKLCMHLEESKGGKVFLGRAQHALDFVLRTSPDDLEAISYRFKVLMLRGKFAGAFRDAERAIDLDPKLNFLWDSIIPWSGMDGGSARKSVFKYFIGRLQRVGDKPPFEIWKPFYRAILFQQLLDFPAQADAIRQVDKLMTDRYRWMHAFIGKFKLYRGQWNEAIDRFQTGLRSHPEIWKIQCFLGEAQLGLGQTLEAMSEFDKAVIASGSHSDALAWRGEIHLWLGNYQAALRDLSEAIRLNSTLAFCWLGGALVKMNRHREAIEKLDRAIKSHPSDAEAYTWRAEAKSRLGNHLAALKDVNKAIYFTGGIWAYINRAMIYGKLGNLARMRRDFDRITLHYPKSARFIINKIGFSPLENPEDKMILDFLEAGLTLSLGNRRDEEYAALIWMANCR